MRISTLCNICYIVVSRELLLYVFLQKLLHCLNKFKNRHRAVCRCRFVSDSWASCLLLVTSASDLLVHTIRLCSVVFGVMSSLAVIHTIYRRLSSVVFVIVYSERARWSLLRRRTTETVTLSRVALGGRIPAVYDQRYIVSVTTCEMVAVVGATENAGVENAGVDSRGGKCRSKPYGTPTRDLLRQS